MIITSNYKTDGIYLAADDRRHYVAWSNRTEMDFEEGYWRDLYGWYKGGGVEHVAAYLDTYDLTNFDPKAPPPKTSAFYEIARAGKALRKPNLQMPSTSSGGRTSSRSAKLLTKPPSTWPSRFATAGTPD